MTPAARLSAAIEVLDQYLAGTAAEKALTNWARRSRFAGSKDRAAVRDIVFDCLRKRGTYARLGLSGRGLVLCHTAQNATRADLDRLFSGEGHAPAPLSEAENVGLYQTRFRASKEMLCNMPDWLTAELVASVGDDAPAIAAALAERAAVYLRVNLSKASREDAIASLAADGVVAKPYDDVRTALEVLENPRKIAASRAYADGLIELQDAASQALCAELPKAAAMLDYCAGGGGKILAYGALHDARLFAHDANPARLRDLAPRAERAGVKVSILSQSECRTRAPFDLVLCDVPCSGSGAWRRSPEGKWSLTRDQFDALLKTQQQILHEAASLVSQQGTLAYATCSLFQRENEAQVVKFCEANDGWQCTYQRRYSPMEGADGFYIAYLTHTASSD